MTRTWDETHSNSDDLVDDQQDMDRVWQAFHIFDSDKYAAFQIWFNLAQQGSVWSMIEIAKCYQFGSGVSCDDEKSEQWYKHAFAGGSQVAMIKCAWFAASRRDFAACEAILDVGVKQEWASAFFYLAWYRLMQSGCRETYNKIKPLLEYAAERGHPAAQVYLVRFMVRGRFGRLKIPQGFGLGWKFIGSLMAEREAIVRRELSEQPQSEVANI